MPPNFHPKRKKQVLLPSYLVPPPSCLPVSVSIFFKAEDGIRYVAVTGVQTCALPIYKSISHRAALFGAIASGRTEVTGYLEAEASLNTLKAVRALGVLVTRKGPGHYLVDGAGLFGLREPEQVIDLGNSGTAVRLLMGVLAGQPFWTFLTGDDSLRRRAMGRVGGPLTRMGATVVGRGDGSGPPR